MSNLSCFAAPLPSYMGNYLHTLSVSSFKKKIPYTVETITVTAFQPAVQKPAPKHNCNFSEQRPDGRKKHEIQTFPEDCQHWLHSWAGVSRTSRSWWTRRPRESPQRRVLQDIKWAQFCCETTQSPAEAFFFHGLKCLSMALESLTNTITAWRTWISWVFNFLNNYTAQLSMTCTHTKSFKAARLDSRSI